MTGARGDETGASGDRAPGDVAPDGYLQGEARTLLDVLGGFEAEGYRGQLAERDGTVRCLTCETRTEPAAFPIDRVERLEGASDPADMLMVLGGRCPFCGTLGTLTLNFGPTATAGEDRLLERLVLPAG